MVNVEFSLDNNHRCIYYAGQQLSGTVTLTCEEVIEVRAAYFQIEGSTHNHWTRQATKSSGCRTQFYTKHINGRKDYINIKSEIKVPDKENSITTIKPGTYTYHFNAQIPPHCPSSFESKHGYTRYYLKVVLIKPWIADQTFTKVFNVIKVVDLNPFGSAHLHGLVTHEEAISYIPWKSIPVHICVQIPKCGYLPGETVPVNVHIDNKSSVYIKETILRLVMNTTFFSSEPEEEKSKSLTIQEVKGPSIDKKKIDILNLNIRVPATPPTCKDPCHIIHVSYEIEFVLVTNFLHKNLSKKIDLVIGTIPLKANLPNKDNQSLTLINLLDGSGSSLTPTKDFPNGGLILYPVIGRQTNEEQLPFNSGSVDRLKNLPPASFVEVAHVPIGELEHEEGIENYGETIFKPCYPQFNVTSSLTSSKV